MILFLPVLEHFHHYPVQHPAQAMQGEKQAQIHISKKAPVDKVITRIAQGSKNATRSTITRKTITAPIQASNLLYLDEHRPLVKKIRLASMTLFLVPFISIIYGLNLLDNVQFQIADCEFVELTNTCRFLFFFICGSTISSMIAIVIEIYVLKQVKDCIRKVKICITCSRQVILFS